MVVLTNKSKTANQSPLNLTPNTNASDLKGTTPFALVLERFGTKSSMSTVQNGLKISANTSEKATENVQTTKSEKLLEMLQGKSDDKLSAKLEQTETVQVKSTVTKSEQKELPLQINPEITKNLTPQELKVLIKDAKKYLKEQILNSEGFKKSEAAALPKTLKGLVQVAKKFDIDVSKITLEKVREQSPSKDVSTKNSTKIDVKTEVEAQKQKTTQDVVTKTEGKKQTDDVDTLTTIKEHSKGVKEESKALAHNAKTDRATQTEESFKQELQKERPKVSQTPLFGAQTKKEISTEEIVTAKSAVHTLVTPKAKSDENLKLLLRTDKNAKSQSSLTPDFSVATARVIAPSIQEQQIQPMQSKETLANLLGSAETTESTTQSKLDGLNSTNKSDSLDVKINEAKQMIKYLSSDVKSAIEDYKSPFTRVKVQLNPQKLGEIDLTVVQRGKNLHISLSANNTAINTLAMNAGDLRAQLQNSGINNATLNFSNNPQGQDGSASQQQNSHQQQRESAHKEYSYYENQEAHDEVVDSLEIIVPHYA